MEIIGDLPLAQAYIPKQPYSGIFDIDEALARGTAFPELSIPWVPLSELRLVSDCVCNDNSNITQ